jgi:uncharacterized protein
MKNILLIIVGTLLLPVAQAASFDCLKAKSRIERMICKENGLSSQDVDLAKRYQYAIQNSSDKEKIISEQRQWLTNVRNACQDEDCLASTYGERNRELALLFPYTLDIPDCTFPSRTNSFGWISAGNGGVWRKSIPGLPGIQKGYFRFINYSNTPKKENKLYVEAWQYMDFNQPEIWVGCIEINDSLIATASQLTNFKFRASLIGNEVFLDFDVYGKNKGVETKLTPHTIKIPFDFINNIN